MISYDQLEGTPKQVKWAYSILKSFLQKLDLNNVTGDDLICLGCAKSGLIIDYRDLISVGNSAAFVNAIGARWIDLSKVDEYTTILIEKYRSPSKGGNTSALHSHRLVIEGKEYFFKARGAKKWVYKTDKCIFAWYLENDRNQILKETLEAYDKNKKFVARGDRRAKNVLRTADQRLPCSRREARD